MSSKRQAGILGFMIVLICLVMATTHPDEIIIMVHHKSHPAPVEVQPKVVAVTFKAKVTGYCPCIICCEKYADGKTSQGVDADLPGIAADPKRIPYGTVLKIPGYGIATVDVTGGAMRQSEMIHFDVRFPTHQEALNWGVQYLEVEIQ